MSGRSDPSTAAARAGLGHDRSGAGADLVAPITVASVRAYADLEAVDAGMETREAYRRYGGGSPALLEDCLAELETPAGAAPALCRVTSSGQAALLLATLLVVTPARRRIVLVRPAYGATEGLLTGPLGALGVQLSTVDLPPSGDADAGELVGPVLGADVAAVVTEVITNPLMTLVDVPAVAAAAHGAGAASVVDGTFATPLLFRGFDHGADLVFHSLTKHLSGHSDVLGGALLVSADRPAADWLDAFARLAGCNLGPFDAWLALRGVRTAALRLERSSENAAALAEWFAPRPDVVAVHYPGRHSPAEERLAQRLLPRGRGAMLGVELRDVGDPAGQVGAEVGVADAVLAPGAVPQAVVQGRLEGVEGVPRDVRAVVEHRAINLQRRLRLACARVERR